MSRVGGVGYNLTCTPHSPVGVQIMQGWDDASNHLLSWEIENVLWLRWNIPYKAFGKAFGWAVGFIAVLHRLLAATNTLKKYYSNIIVHHEKASVPYFSQLDAKMLLNLTKQQWWQSVEGCWAVAVIFSTVLASQLLATIRGSEFSHWLHDMEQH